MNLVEGYLITNYHICIGLNICGTSRFKGLQSTDMIKNLRPGTFVRFVCDDGDDFDGEILCSDDNLKIFMLRKIFGVIDFQNGKRVRVLRTLMIFSCIGMTALKICAF